MSDIESMSKDELEAYAITHFGKELDKRKSIDSLRKEVAGMAGTTLGAEDESAPKEKESLSDWLKHPINGRVFPSTDLLRKRGDMIPCDADGNAL